ncbi:MAG: ABC transporter ATP-binding protein [Tissierellia bacterium]|nr:ABC transporter ATP-binding protein [Tissierellia bacterium]
MLKLLKHIDKKSWILILLVFFLIWGQVGLDLQIPAYMSEVTEIIKSDDKSIDSILEIGLKMLIIAIGSLLISVIVAYMVSFASAKFSSRLRSLLYNKVQDLSLEEVHSFNTASLTTRTTNDINQIEMMLGMGVQSVFQAPIMAIWAMRRILSKNWQWSLATGLAIFILLAIVGVLLVLVLPRFTLVQKLIDKINLITRENLTGIRVIRAFNAEEYQLEKFQKANEDLTSTQTFNQRVFATVEPLIYLVMFLLSLSIFYLGALIVNDATSIERASLFGDMVVFSAYALQLIFSFLTMAFILVTVSRGQVSAKRINEVLDSKSQIRDGQIDRLRREGIKLEFDQVSFSYKDAKSRVLSDVSFELESGQILGVIGSTGSGKSTLINLLTRFYDPKQGRILINDIDIRDYTRRALNDAIGYVPQKAVIFDMSVLENVKYGRLDNMQVSDQDAIKALEVAQAKDFVERLDRSYNTRISRDGKNLSGGQKQRISIARAIARRPSIYIFDDSFSALDNKTDLMLRKALSRLDKDSIKIIIATKVSTILNADKILVLDKGEVVGLASHEDLLKTSEVYKQIALSQLPQEELIDE